MDSLSQIVLGGAVGEAVLGRKIGNKAILWGAIAGTIPDLDVIPGQFMETVARVDFHRSMTHSLLFAFVVSPLMAWLVQKLHKKDDATFWQWSHLFFWGFFTHALLDCATTWGTQLFWPFTDYRVAWKNIAVVDPLYTIPFLSFLIAVMFFHRSRKIRSVLNWTGIAVSCAYLGLTFINKRTMEHRFTQQLHQQNIAFSRISTTPTLLNNALWRAAAEVDSGFYLGHASLFDEVPPSFYFIEKKHHLLGLIGVNERVSKLLKITDGYFILRESEGKLVLSDLRFGQLAGWDSPESPFVFNYYLSKTALDDVNITRSEPHFGNTDIGELIGKLWQRIKGIDANKPVPQSRSTHSVQ